MRYLSLFASHDSSLDLVILFVGQSIAAMGQPLFTNFPAVIAMEWFPVEQRDMATIIAAISNLIGNAAGQVIPPLLVPEGNLDSGLKQLLLGEFFLTAAGLLIAGGRPGQIVHLTGYLVLFVRERPHHLVPSKAMAKILNSGAVEHKWQLHSPHLLH